MKKFLLFVLILSFSGCSWLKFWEKAEKPTDQNEKQEIGSILKVQVSTHAPSLISKRIGVIPFTDEDETTGLFISNAVADNLLTSGLHVIESKYLLSELIKLLEDEETSGDIKNEWKAFKRLFDANDSHLALNNLILLRKLDLVDYLLTGSVNVKSKWFSFKNAKVNEARLDIIDIKNGEILYSLNYSEDEEGEGLTPREISEKLANALVSAMQ